MEGEVLADRYELGARLGAGGMAEVRAAYDRRLQRPVAVKTLLPHLAAYPGLRERFASEARTAARLQHPSAVAVYDTGEDGNVPFIVMELLPGATLADRLVDGPADPAWLVPVAIQVLDALDAAHKAGLVHRDVKPGNILLTEDGRAKVADFGIAKAADTGSDLTRTGQLVGTAAYLPPEAFEGAPPSPLGDVYAMGVVMYEALSGGKPFTGDSPIAVAYAIAHNPVMSITAHCPTLDPELAAAIDRAMARDPEMRFASAAVMAEVLRKLPEGRRSPEAVPVAPPAAPKPKPTRTRPAAAVPTMVPDATKGLDLPMRSRRSLSRRQVLIGAGALAVAGAVAVGGAVLAGGNDGGGTQGDDADRAEVAGLLRDAADRIQVGDGPKGPEAAQRLRALAQAVETGGGADEATALARDVAAWRESGELFRTASRLTMERLAQVPGAEVTITD